MGKKRWKFKASSKPPLFLSPLTQVGYYLEAPGGEGFIRVDVTLGLFRVTHLANFQLFIF